MCLHACWKKIQVPPSTPSNSKVLIKIKQNDVQRVNITILKPFTFLKAS